MKKLFGICLIVFLFGLAYSVGFEGSLLTTEGDTLTNTVVKAKQGTAIVDQCVSNLYGYYSVDFGEVGVVPYQLPSDDMILGNSLTSNGRVIAYTSNSDCEYNIFDIRGRNVTGNTLTSGKYFLQLVDARTKEILGVRPFINMSYGKMQVQIKSFESPSFAKATVDDDSLVVEYTGTDMLVHPYREKVILPEEGFEHKDLLLQRERRDPIVSVVMPDTMTIDTSYVLKIDAVCEDYDADVANISVQYVGADSIAFEQRFDSLIVSPHTAGEYTFQVIVDDDQGGQAIEEINVEVLSTKHIVKTLDFFYNLGGAFPGLEVILKGDTLLTNNDGLAIFEFQILTQLSNTDTVEVYNPNNDTTFYNMALPVEIGIDTQFVQTLTDPQGPNYYSKWVIRHTLHRLSYLDKLSLNNYTWPVFGDLENGRADTIFIYCPNHTSSSGLEYRPIIEQTINERNQDLDERAGVGKLSRVHLKLSENTQKDSLYVDEFGILLIFDPSESNHTENTRNANPLTGEYYIVEADAYIAPNIDSSAAGIQGLINLFDHEALGHGLGNIGHTPYNTEHTEYQENMNVGAGHSLKDHEKDNMFIQLNYLPSNTRTFKNHERFHLAMDYPDI
jgi:hypothetical protein